jgi:polysaccharide export outer membrane protein
MISRASLADEIQLPKELVQYIRESKKRGETDDKIKSQAVAAGWPAIAVDQAIAYGKSESGKSTEPAVPATVEAAPQTSPSVPSQLQPVQPLALATAPTESPDRTLAQAGAPANRGVSDEYQIGSGDTLQISVWKEPDASVPSVIVRPDGKISVPLIKELEVAGLTPKQAEQRITEGLAKFINNADVTVVVAAINSKKIYIIGAVRKEGLLPYTYRMSVMQALSEAGGLTDYAKRKKIYILRTEGGREYRLDFNYEEVVKGQRMEQNILLMSGDTVVIPH